MSGHEFELLVALVLQDNGHHAAVTKGSGDFGVDLVLNGEIAVQVKMYGSPVGPSAVQQVCAGKAVYNCLEAWVITDSTFTPAAITLAQANGVRLIDGEELDWMAANPDRLVNHRERYEAHQAAEEARLRADRRAEFEELKVRMTESRAAFRAEMEEREAERQARIAAYPNDGKLYYT